VDEWLPEQHLARFVVEVVEGFDLRAMIGSYRGSGSASYHPKVLLALLVYGYATGVFSSRKLERASYDSVAFRFIAANDHPDHDTIAAFRRRFLPEIEGLFVQVLLVAREMGILKMGTVGLDGTKIHANASRHSALSYEHAGKIEAQLQAEVADLMAKAEAADQADLPDGFSIPEELALREERLRKLAEARAKIEARAKERHAREQAEYEAKLAARKAKEKRTGKKPGGKPPSPPASGPSPADQINLTDEDSRIMPVAGGGFEQCLYEESQYGTVVRVTFFAFRRLLRYPRSEPDCMTRLVAEPDPAYIRSAVRDSGTNIPLAADKGSGRRDHSTIQHFRAKHCFGSSTWIRQD
jgi:transposase